MRRIQILSAVGGLMVALCIGPAKAAEGEKVLFGFERAEVDKAVAGAKVDDGFQALENGDFLFFRVKGGFEGHEREMAAIRPMRCVQDQASHGKHSCRVEEVLDGQLARVPSFRMPRIPAIDLYDKTPQSNLRMPELLNTAGWFDWAFPRDWSGYDLLRVDVRLDQGEQADKLMLEVEDDLVEPPVSLTYPAPAPGQWVTLQMDLAAAVKDRGLDLKKMNNIWVRLVLKDPERQTRAMGELWKNKDKEELNKRKFVAYVDNIRLAAKGAPAKFPTPAGTRSGYSASLPRAYAAVERFIKQDPDVNGSYWPNVFAADPKMPAAVKPAAPPAVTALAPAAVIPIREMIAKGCMLDEPSNAQIHSNIRLTSAAASDSGHIIVGFDLYGSGSLRVGPGAERVVGNNASAAVATTDGGKSWKGLDGTDWPTVLGGNQSKIPPRVIDLGGDIMAVSAFGCLAARSAHIGYPVDRAFFIRSVFTGQKWWVSPNYLISGEPRHCHWLWWADAVRAPSGRIWAAWEALDRDAYEEAPDYPRTLSVFVYCSDDNGRTWQSWRGAGLSGSVPAFGSRFQGGRYVRLAPYRDGVAVFCRGGWTWFDGNKWSDLAPTGADPCWSAVSCGQEIYLSDMAKPVRWYDGKAWADLSVPGGPVVRGRVGVCGDKTAVLVGVDPSEKKLLCWRKTPGGAWRGPQTLASEPTTIKQLTAARYAPADFLPVAYMCLAKEEEGKAEGGPRSRATPGNEHYKGNPPARLFWTYPSAHWVHEPWIKLLKAPTAIDHMP